MITLNGIQVTPTIFPDKTSQVWQVQGISPIQNHVVWEFENEAEFMHVAQLVALLNKEAPESTVLEIPFFPYARQDKAVGNNETFAGWVFVELLKTLNVRVVTHDIHSTDLLEKSWVNLTPNDRIKQVIDEIKPDLVCFPDVGASRRGYDTHGLPSFNLEKKRNQQTGEIEGLENNSLIPISIKGLNILIIDDLCDRGGTFMAAAKLLKDLGASTVSLYTTHGLYTGGTQLIFDNSIDRIFNLKREEICQEKN